MKIVRNLGDRYKLLDGYTTVELIHKALKDVDGKGLSYKQMRDLREAFGDKGSRGNLGMPFIAYSWNEMGNSTKPMWRLTLPFFAVYILLLFVIVLPVKWIVTGKVYFSENNWFTRFNTNWYNRIFDKKWYD